MGYDLLVLGILQGFLEWLPISSQGNVAVAATALLHVDPQVALKYALLLHAGTLLAAIVYFRKEWTQIAQKPDQPLTHFLIVAVVGIFIEN